MDGHVVPWDTDERTPSEIAQWLADITTVCEVTSGFAYGRADIIAPVIPELYLRTTVVELYGTNPRALGN